MYLNIIRKDKATTIAGKQRSNEPWEVIFGPNNTRATERGLDPRCLGRMPIEKGWGNTYLLTGSMWIVQLVHRLKQLRQFKR